MLGQSGGNWCLRKWIYECRRKKREKKTRESEGERNTETNTETGAETEIDKFMNNYTVCTRKDAHIFTPTKRKEKKKGWW